MWTDPKAWGATDTPTAAELDAHVSQNLLALRFVTKRQTEDVIVNASTAFNNLPGLSFYVLSGESWVFYSNIYVLSNATADIKVTADAPLASSGHFGVVGSGNEAATHATQTVFGSGCSIVMAAANQNVTMAGRVTAGRNGTVKLQGTQNTSTAFNTTFYAGSWLIAFRQP